MTEPIRILILEDNPTDAELVQLELEVSGLAFTAKVVVTEDDFIRDLQEYSPDLILSDYDLPQYTGALALAEARRRRPDTPFILVTGAVTEDRAIEILTQGAKDYVLKTRLRQRLAPAVMRAMAEAQEHRARKLAEEAVRKAKQFFSATIDALTTHICVMDAKGTIVSVNKAWLDFALGNPPVPGHYREGTNYLDVCDRAVGADVEEAKAFAAGIRAVIKGEQEEYSLEYPCHSPTVKRWFIGRATRFIEDGETWIVAAHDNITERKQAEEKMKAALRERETMLKEIHHRVKNNLQLISILLDLESAYLKDEKAKEMLRNSIDRLSTMANIHSLLYQSEDLSKVDFGGFIRDLAGSLQQFYRITESAVVIHVDAADIPLGIETSIPCGLILNELISNAFKHAFPGGRSGEIDIRMTRDGDHFLLTVRDNGIGFPSSINFRDTESLGLVLVNLLVKQINGAITLKVDQGSTFTVTFPAVSKEGPINGMGKAPAL